MGSWYTHSRGLVVLAVVGAPLVAAAAGEGRVLVVKGTRIESQAGARFCVGEDNRMHVEIQRRGKKPEPPVRVYRQRWVAPRVAGGGTSVEIPANQLGSPRLSASFDRVRIERQDSAAGYFELWVVEGPSYQSGARFRVDIGPNTDWSLECGGTK